MKRRKLKEARIEGGAAGLAQFRARGKKPNTAITIVARRMCRILYGLLSEKRTFEKRLEKAQNKNVPGCSGHRLTAVSLGRS
jgi:hypothetical protein